MRKIRDEYELPDDGDIEDGYAGALLRKRPRPVGKVLAALAVVALFAAAFAGVAYVGANEREDGFCVSCHTVPEQTYFDRGNAAVGGALALDLASYHYQQIRGTGADIRCVQCHEGDGGLGAFVDKRALSASNLIRWLSGDGDPRVEKSVLGVSLRAPHLSNDGCAGCHREHLLLAGQDNHHHNTLPVAYTTWKNGGQLIAPRGATDVQAIIAAGLARYETTVQCAACHPAHRALEAAQYLDPQTVRAGCIQCHVETGQGPADVTYSPEE
jgi:hypothetical protein